VGGKLAVDREEKDRGKQSRVIPLTARGKKIRKGANRKGRGGASNMSNCSPGSSGGRTSVTSGVCYGERKKKKGCGKEKTRVKRETTWT